MSRYFDGIDDVIDFGNILNFERGDAFTLCLWYKPNVASPTVNYAVISKEQGSGNFTGYAILVLGSSAGDPYRLNMLNNAAGNSITVNYPRTNDTNWHHIAWTYSGNSNASGIKFYEDGSAKTQTIISNALSASMVSATNFQLGARDSGTFGNQSLAHIEVFNRELSRQEVISQMRFPNSNKYGQVFYSPLLGANPELDYSSNGYVGTITGSILYSPDPPINGISTISSPQLNQVF